MSTVWTTCRLCGEQRVPFGYVGDVVGSVCMCRFEGPAGTGYGAELQRLIADRQLAERDARIAELGRALDEVSKMFSDLSPRAVELARRVDELQCERDEATAATKTLREAADELLAACDTSDGCCYGTLSTSFVKQVLGERGTDRDALVAQLERERDEARSHLQSVVSEVQDLIGESHGVYGLHLNGDAAPWSEIVAGGRFERIASVDAAREYIDAAMKGGGS